MGLVFMVAGVILLILNLRACLKRANSAVGLARGQLWLVFGEAISRARFEDDENRRITMPFSGNCHSFDPSALKELNGAGAVYGLFKTDLPFRPDHYTCLYVGQTSDLRTAMLEAYDNPPTIGVTHFFAEAIASEEQRNRREKELICEFHPIGNRTNDADPNGPPDAHRASSSWKAGTGQKELE